MLGNGSAFMNYEYFGNPQGNPQIVENDKSFIKAAKYMTITCMAIKAYLQLLNPQAIDPAVILWVVEAIFVHTSV